MNNSQQATTAELPIAIVRHTVTVAITFVEKPSDERRRQLRDAGYRYENGQWYKSKTQGENATDSIVARVIAA